MARTLSTTLAVIAIALVVTPAVAHDAPAAPGASTTPVASAARMAQPAEESVRDIIVRRRPGLDSNEREALRRDADVRLQETTRLPDTEVVRAEPERLEEAVAALERDPDVVYAEPDAIVHAASPDPFWSLQWSLQNAGQSILSQAGTPDVDVDVPDVWAMGASGAGQVVAVVDTGILASHPDLGSQQAASPRGWDFDRGDATPEDAHGHGTHVAGTIAASQDGVGVSGVAPGARIVALRALGADGAGQASNVAKAFDYAGDMQVPIVNASLASVTESETQHQVIREHPNTLYIVAAGNGDEEGNGFDTDATATHTYPCVDPEANVICVAATDNRDALARFSNFGSTSVDLGAPGVSIVSDYVSSLGAPTYMYMSGTSMAAPHVAATLALMRQAAPGLTAVQLKAALLSAVEHKDSLDGRTVTGGRLNTYAAVQRALNGAPVANPDHDLDGIPNASDNCPAAGNPFQADSDRDGTGDVCDPAVVATAPAAPLPAVVPKAPTLTKLTPLRATATLCRSARRCKAKPALFTVRLDRDATLRVELERRSCKRGKCRYKKAATVSQRATPGTNTLKIGASAATRRLASGTYRLRVVAVSGTWRSGLATSRLRIRRG